MPHTHAPLTVLGWAGLESNMKGRLARLLCAVGGLAAVLSFTGAPPATAMLPAKVERQISEAVQRELVRTGTPGASIAVVRNGEIVLARAYGLARLSPARPATPDQPFPLGSVSKEFTAAAALLVTQDGRLDLDAPADRWMPELPGLHAFTLRQALGHVAGLIDYWPQDFVPDYMLRDTTRTALLHRWSTASDDFSPGTAWRYSNTGFVLAAEVVERAGGRSLHDLLRARVFTPLSLRSAYDLEADAPPADAPLGYTRWALGAPRAAPREGRGWLTGAGQLAMTASDLARWDLAMINRQILLPQSWAQMQRSAVLANGRTTGYGLGLHVGSDGDQRYVWHTGALSGFQSVNRIWPELRAAVVVLTNSDYGEPGAIADRIGEFLPLEPRPDASSTARARAMLARLAAGRVGADALTPVGAAFFSPEMLRTYGESLRPLGHLRELRPVSRASRGGLEEEVFTAVYGARTVRIISRRRGEVYEQFSILPQ